jgi:hypothetical protein
MNNAGSIPRRVAALRNRFPGKAFEEETPREKRTGVMGLFTKDIETMDELLLHGLSSA